MSCIQAQASATVARSVLDAMNKAWRRQYSADWAARALTDLCDISLVWSTGWRQLRAQSDAEFREAVERGQRTARHWRVVRETDRARAPEDPMNWATAEASDDEDDAPMPDAPLEPELNDMPPAAASAPKMSSLERCIALRLVYGAGPRQRLQKIALHHISASLSVVSRVGCLVCPGPHPCFHVLTTSPRLPDRCQTKKANSQ